MSARLLRFNECVPRPPRAEISRAFYAYPREHYPHWQTLRAQAGAAPWNAPMADGFMGEHLTLEGLLEKDVWIGDVLRFPNCQLAVSEPGSPSADFDASLGFAQASKMMVQSGWCGFYLAVRVPGPMSDGDPFDLVPGPRHVGIAERFASLHRSQRRKP